MNNKLDNLIRDLTQAGSIPKSEAKKRIEELLSQAVEAERERMQQIFVDAGFETLEQVKKEAEQAKAKEIIYSLTDWLREYANGPLSERKDPFEE